MKQIISLICIIFLCQNSFSQNDWENPEMFQQNREKAHASFYPYSSLEKALNNDPAKEEYIQYLNGKWRFHYTVKVSERHLIICCHCSLSSWDIISGHFNKLSAGNRTTQQLNNQQQDIYALAP